MEKLTRLFYVVDSREDNEEIYETRERAEAEFNLINAGDGARLYIAEVRNFYKEEDINEWNYEDLADTFNIIKIIEKKK